MMRQHASGAQPDMEVSGQRLYAWRHAMSSIATPPKPTSLAATWWSNGPLLLTLCMAFWAASVVVGRAAAADIPPSLFTVLRWAGALAIALPLAWPHLRADLPALARGWKVLAVLAFLGVGAYNNLVYHGLHSTTAVNALLLNSATPLFVLIAVFVLYRERPTLRQTAAIMISIAGVVVIAARGSLQELATLRLNPGDVLVTAAVALYAIYPALLRQRPRVHHLSLLAALIALGTLFMVPFAVTEYAAGARLIPTPLALLSLGYAAIFPAFVCYLLYNRGVELIGAARAGQYIHLMPVFGVLLATAALGESLLAYHGVGIALIAAGLWLAR